MILEYKVNEQNVQDSWLKALYVLVSELDCKCKTHVEEAYSQEEKRLSRTRVIEVSGSDTMLTGLKYRMERFLRNVIVGENIVAELH